MTWKLLLVLMITEVYGNPVADTSPTPIAKNATEVLKKGHHVQQKVAINGLTCTCNIGASVMSGRDDYQHVPGIGSYKLHKRGLNWNTARKTCKEEDAHLVIINSAVEALVLRDMMKKAGGQAVWVGVHDLYKEGEWTTIFGETLERAGYDNWRDNEPNNAGGKEDCAVLFEGGGLNDMSCDSISWYICELSIIRHVH